MAKLRYSGFEAIDRSPRRVTESAAIEEPIQRDQDRVLVVTLGSMQVTKFYETVDFRRAKIERDAAQTFAPALP